MPYSFFFFETIWWIVILSCIGFLFWIWKWGSWSTEMRIIISIIIAFLLIVIFYGSFIEPQKLIVQEIKIESELKESLKIGLVSDIHTGPYKKKEFIQKIVKKLNAQNLDIILIPGDFLYGDSRFIDQLEPLKDLKAPTYFVLGNHDHQWNGALHPNETKLLAHTLKEWGLMELRNESIKFLKNIWIVGVNDPYLGFDEFTKAFQDVPKDASILFLAHSPDIIKSLSKSNWKPVLTVTGHTHGGQIRFPFIGAIPITVPIKNKKYIKGWFENERMYVTSGSGEVGTRARLLNPPEIVIITIKSRDK